MLNPFGDVKVIQKHGKVNNFSHQFALTPCSLVGIGVADWICKVLHSLLRDYGTP